MSRGRSGRGGMKGGRTNAKLVDYLEIDCEPARIHPVLQSLCSSSPEPEPSRKTYENKDKDSFPRKRRGAHKAGIPISRHTPNANRFRLEREDWPELPQPYQHSDYPQPVVAVREELKAEIKPATKCTMNAEDTCEDWGCSSPLEEPTSLKEGDSNTTKATTFDTCEDWGCSSPLEEPTSPQEGDSNTTKATTFDMAKFLKSNPELREMELAVVMAIDEMRKQKMLSNEDQALLMYQLPNLCTYQTPVSEGSFFYPGIPLYSLLAEIFEEWMYSGACFAKDLLTYEHLDEGNGLERRKMTLDNVTCHMMGIRGSWEGLEDDEKKHKIRQMFKDIGKRGLLDLLGIRRTVGSQEVFPPTRDILEASFRELNKASSQLTVGARALEKHCHRDQSNNWWGRPKGGEKSKNDNAERVLNKILNEVGWLNIHQLPHALPILEVRNTDGYGARWSPDGKEFRGFLEPPMIAGWETGYKH